MHRQAAPTREAFDLVWTHCRIVWSVASQLITASEAGVDTDLVRAGCLLHDIGVYRLAPSDAYVRHGVLGAELLAELGLPEVLCRFCSHHTGVGITAADVTQQGLPMPVADYLAETPEERIVMYADKFHSKSTPPSFVTSDTFVTSVARFGPDKPARFSALASEFGQPNLTPLVREFGHSVR
ncbi:HD domain-containing protein [Actinoplanes sp. DH11]|uniref:HD domain-containing protein n=1 Tax=Actinoplanes sp. DH11 TaxID=2857011 RepID=UPI001E64DD9B|nr:HD domain-containing protein [Actinoplanes sp. DH11]